MISVQHNMLAMNADRQLNVNTKKNAKLTEKLSSGYRINRAADDAAGLAISEKMRRQIRGLHQAADNIKDGIAYVQTAEGALNEVHDMLQRINELSVKAANGTNTPQDREYIDLEVQQIKKELDRIFDTTTFNERKIWDYGPGEQLPYTLEPAVTFPYANSSTSITGGVTNTNCGVIAASAYTVHADNSGVWVTWTGYDTNNYTTQKVDWDTLERDNYTFKMEEHFGDKVEANKLYTYNTATGQYDHPVINKTVTFEVNPHATRQDIINSINNGIMDSSTYAYMSVDNDDCNLLSDDKSKTVVYVSYKNLTYPAAYLSWAKSPDDTGYDFDGEDDDFLEPDTASANLTSYPSITDVTAAKNSNAGWTFSFDMDGIGKVTATSTSSEFHSSDAGYYEPEDEDIWWEYYVNSKGETKQRTLYKTSGGNIGSVIRGLTGGSGLLSKGNNGWSDRGGTIVINFSITPNDKTLTYGTGSKLTSIGSFELSIPVTASDTEAIVLKKINDALNGNTVLDFTTTGNTQDSAYIYGLSGKTTNIKIPYYPPDYVPYDDTQHFFVQAGAEAGQHISIDYEFLSVEKLGMEDTNVLTQESASNAINEVKEALQIVSKQRSDFGAYQNRLEHAYNIDKNVEENTQSAESLIRDADIADLMMEYSVNNILMQAGVSMLTQANQSGQLVVELLQQ